MKKKKPTQNYYIYLQNYASFPYSVRSVSYTKMFIHCACSMPRIIRRTIGTEIFTESFVEGQEEALNRHR